MPTLPCPSCKKAVGWMRHDGGCPSCGEELPFEYGRTLERRAEAAPPPPPKPCFFCGRSTPGNRTRFLCVSNQRLSLARTVLAGAQLLDGQDAVNRTTHALAVSCCAECFAPWKRLWKARLYSLPLAIIGVVVAWFAVAGVYALVGPRQGPAVVVLGLSSVVALVWAFVYACRRIGRKTRDAAEALLEPALNARLKQLAGVRDWGFRHVVQLMEDHPPDASVAPVEAVLPEFVGKAGRPGEGFKRPRADGR